MKKQLLVIATFLGLSFSAKAGLIIEPYYNYIASGKSGTATLSGSEMGGRVGYSMLGLGVGVDYIAGGTSTSDDAGVKSDYKPSGMGFFVSYKFPILLRGYASYIPSYMLKNSTYECTYTGTKIGVQYTGLPFIAIGLESESLTAKKIKTVASGAEMDATGTGSVTSLTVSVPFDL